MPNRITVVFDDEELYAEFKEVAERSGVPAKDIVAEAIRDWLESKDDEGICRDVNEARREWEIWGGVEAGEFFS